MRYCTQRSLNLSICFVFDLQVGNPTAVIRQPYEGKVISQWKTDPEHERHFESPAVCLKHNPGATKAKTTEHCLTDKPALNGFYMFNVAVLTYFHIHNSVILNHCVP